MKITKIIGILTIFLFICGIIPSTQADTVCCWVDLGAQLTGAPYDFYLPIYDTLNDRILLFYNDDGEETVYAYNANADSWTSKSSPGMPTRMLFLPMVYDSKNNVSILFGSNIEWLSEGLNETWAYYYETNTWTNMNPPVAPPARLMNSMVYDSNSGKIIMFGGVSQMIDPKIYYNDVWAYDFAENNWTDVTPTVGTSPVPRFMSSMTFDIEANCTLVFSGATDFQNTGLDGARRDLWAYFLENQSWTQKTSHVARRSHSIMSYDPGENKHILFGGTSSWNNWVPTDNSDETWIYDYPSDEWELLDCSTKPLALSDIGLVFNSKLNRSYMYGGNNGAYLRTLFYFSFDSGLCIPEYSNIASILLLTSIPIVAMVALIVLRKRRRIN